MNLNQNTKEKIQALDLSKIVEKLIYPDRTITNIKVKWTREMAEEAVQQYKNYLWLRAKYSEEHSYIPPSVEIDEVWHAHILDTKKYANDCMAIFGYFLHHDPYFGLKDSEELALMRHSFEVTQELHFKEFGDYIYSIEN